MVKFSILFFTVVFALVQFRFLCEFSGSIIYDPATTYNDHTDPKLSIQGPRNNLFSSYKGPFPHIQPTILKTSQFYTYFPRNMVLWKMGQSNN